MQRLPRVKYTMIASALVIGSFSSVNTLADNNMYVSVGMDHHNTIKLTGRNEILSENSTLYLKPATHPKVTIGMAVADKLDVELYIGQQGGLFKSSSTTSDGLKLKHTHYLVRARYHLGHGDSKMLNPYIGIGYGTTQSVMWIRSNTARDNHPSSQLFIGNRFELDKNWFANLALNHTRVGQSRQTFTDATIGTVVMNAHDVSSVSLAIGRTF